MHRPWQSVSVIRSLWGTACLINGSFVNGVLVLWVQKPLSSHVINGVIRAVIKKNLAKWCVEETQQKNALQPTETNRNGSGG
jgi:hypothetical protein